MQKLRRSGAVRVTLPVGALPGVSVTADGEDVLWRWRAVRHRPRGAPQGQREGTEGRWGRKVEVRPFERRPLLRPL
jgi:hypothetical protein